jgi:hypothetical protein
MVPYFQPMSHPETVESEVSGHWYLAEDFAFCQRARLGGTDTFGQSVCHWLCQCLHSIGKLRK